VGTGFFSLGVKRPGCDTIHLHLGLGLKMSGAVLLLPQYAFMALTGSSVGFYYHQKIIFRFKIYTKENYLVFK